MTFTLKLLFLVLIVQVTVCFSQNKTISPFLNIKPFASTRDDVEKIYGKGNFPKYNPYFVNYKTSELSVLISYSTGGCEKKYSIYNVPEWTVIEVNYSFLKNPPKLKDLTKNDKKFKKMPYGDVINQMKFYDQESGIVIYFDRFTKVVDEISIEPSLKEEQKFACKNLK